MSFELVTKFKDYEFPLSPEEREFITEMAEKLSQLIKIPEDDGRAPYVLRKFAEALNAVISSADFDSYRRWLIHQAVNLSLHHKLATLRREKLVVAAFQRSKLPAELSLFNDGLEDVDRRMYVPPAAIIGIGISSDASPVTLKVNPNDFEEGEEVINWSQNQDFGWSDSFGAHVEYWDAEKREYVRSSMTGRTQYTIRFNQSGRAIEFIV